MYIYVATAPVYETCRIYKIGCTSNPYNRRGTFLTGCPPGMEPSHDIDYVRIWQTSAQAGDMNTLYDYEEIVHEHFQKFRMMRRIPNDSEWFNFSTLSDKSALNVIDAFMESRSWATRVEVPGPLKTSRFMQLSHCGNTKCIRDRAIRNEELDKMQQPMIQKILETIAGESGAGYLVSPCGTGKTRMACVAIEKSRFRRCIICCPFVVVQNQWYNEILNSTSFTTGQVFMYSSSDAGKVEKIGASKGPFCAITTYASSDSLLKVLSDTQLLVLDEAHHVAGLVAQGDNGEGITRKLMQRACEVGVRRLSLTFTPRMVSSNDEDDKVKYLSMDTEATFGKCISDVSVRVFIDTGILPDYRVWTLRDETMKGRGLDGKAECIMEAWNATEIYRGQERYLLHHLVIFVQSYQDAEQVADKFTSQTTDTTVMFVKGGDNIEDAIDTFSSATRAILINCKVLGEGVDIPATNAVAFMYPKQSPTEITQMLFRAGRWYEGKPLFHVLLPLLDQEDVSGFEYVLTALAACDNGVRDEVVLRCKQGTGDTTLGGQVSSIEVDGENVAPNIVVIDSYSSEEDSIKRCFQNVRQKLFSQSETKRIRNLCAEKRVDTHLEYQRLSAVYGLPEDPRGKGQTWYDFLHPSKHSRMLPVQFATKVGTELNIRMAEVYDEWWKSQPPTTQKEFPSIQHINDGYFGSEYTDFTNLVGTGALDLTTSRSRSKRR